jgi:phage shock protein C
MQRIIQINIAGRLIPIEEDAYDALNRYIISLEHQFTGEDGKEIIQDIENRIAELFGIRLQSGANAIDHLDVEKLMQTLGAASEKTDGTTNTSNKNAKRGRSQSYSGYSRSTYSKRAPQPRLLRDPFNKVICGLCSGLAYYFDIDPIIIRLIMVALIPAGGIGLIVYIVGWIAVPAARTPDELYYDTPVSFHDITRNVATELGDLKLRGEKMSRELRDFFSHRH